MLGVHRIMTAQHVYDVLTVCYGRTTFLTALP